VVPRFSLVYRDFSRCAFSVKLTSTKVCFASLPRVPTSLYPLDAPGVRVLAACMREHDQSLKHNSIMGSQLRKHAFFRLLGSPYPTAVSWPADAPIPPPDVSPDQPPQTALPSTCTNATDTEASMVAPREDAAGQEGGTQEPARKPAKTREPAASSPLAASASATAAPVHQTGSRHSEDGEGGGGQATSARERTTHQSEPEGFHRGRWKLVNGLRKGGGLMRSSLRPRVMCGIRDNSHRHMHTQYTHTHTHTHTRTHTHTHITPPTPTPVERSCVCVAMSSLSLSKSLSISLSGCASVCLRGR